MLIRKCQAILKWFIDVKSSAWLMLGSEYETMFCDTNFFRLTAGQRVKNTKWPAVQYFLKKLSNRRIPVSLTCQRSTITATGFVGFLHHFYRCTVLVMSREMFVTMSCKVRCDKCRKTVSFSGTSINKVLDLRSYKIKSFQDCLTFCNLHTMVWISWNSLIW